MPMQYMFSPILIDYYIYAFGIIYLNPIHLIEKLGDGRSCQIG